VTRLAAHFRAIIGPGLLLALLSALAGCGSDPENEEGTRTVHGLSACATQIAGHLYLAALLPYEGVWTVAEPTAHAVIQAVEEINAAGGVDGRLLGLVLCNTKGDRVTAALVMEEVARASPIAGVIGPMRYQAVESAAAVANREEIALVAPAFGVTSVDNRWAVATAPPLPAQGVIAARIVQAKELTAAFVIASDDAASHAMRKAFIDTFATGGDTASYIVYRHEDVDFAETVVNGALAYGPQVVVLIGYPQEATSILQTAINRILRPNLWVFSPTLRSPDFVASVGDNAFLTRARGIGAGVPAQDDYAAFAERYQQLWGEPPEAFSAQAYDAAYLLAIAMALSTNPDDRQQIRDNLLRTGAGPEVHPGAWDKVLEHVPAGQVHYQGAAGPVALGTNDSALAYFEEWTVTSAGGIESVGCWTSEAEPCP